MVSFRLSISNHSVRRARAVLRLLRYKNTKRKLRKRENRLRNKSLTDKRYWRATSKSGTIDLGHMTEREAVEAVIKMGSITYNDWPNAILIYDDGRDENET